MYVHDELRLNVNKCKNQVFFLCKSKIRIMFDIDEVILEGVPLCKDLDVIFNDHFIFNNHVARILNKCNQNVSFSVRSVSVKDEYISILV